MIEHYLSALRDCICEALAKDGQGPTCWCGIWPGIEVAWDYCGDCGNGTCGMGYVQPGIVFPYSTFPFADTESNCSRPLAFQVEVGVVRCMPTMDEDGELPSESEITDTALGMVLDQRALFCAIRDCQARGLVVVEGWNPAGPSGGCVGGAWSIYVDPSA